MDLASDVEQEKGCCRSAVDRGVLRILGRGGRAGLHAFDLAETTRNPLAPTLGCMPAGALCGRQGLQEPTALIAGLPCRVERCSGKVGSVCAEKGF
jgi:hypothetical protein